jgi:hypothetical protein
VFNHRKYHTFSSLDEFRQYQLEFYSAALDLMDKLIKKWESILDVR